MKQLKLSYHIHRCESIGKKNPCKKQIVKATLHLKKSSQETNLESLFNICRSIFGLCLTDKATRNIHGAIQVKHINPQEHQKEAISSDCNANANVKAFPLNSRI